MNISMILKTKGSDVISVAVDDTVGTAARVLSEKKIGALLVTGADGGMRGVLSELDIVRGLGQQGAAAARHRAVGLWRCVPRAAGS